MPTTRRHPGRYAPARATPPACAARSAGRRTARARTRRTRPSHWSMRRPRAGTPPAWWRARPAATTASARRRRCRVPPPGARRGVDGVPEPCDPLGGVRSCLILNYGTWLLPGTLRSMRCSRARTDSGPTSGSRTTPGATPRSRWRSPTPSPARPRWCWWSRARAAISARSPPTASLASTSPDSARSNAFRLPAFRRTTSCPTTSRADSASVARHRRSTHRCTPSSTRHTSITPTPTR